MSPKSPYNKAARLGKDESENSAKSVEKAVHANLPSASPSNNSSGEIVSTPKSTKKRPMPAHNEDLEREQKKQKNEHSVSTVSDRPSKIASVQAGSRQPRPAPKGPAPQSSTLKNSLGPLKEEIRTLREALLDEPDQKALAGEVKEGVYLDDEQVTLAIAAVTEVVNSYYNPDMYLWSLVSSTTLSAARMQPPLDRSSCPRLIRSKLVFPMFLSPTNLTSYPDVITDDRDKTTVYASFHQHIFLVKVLFNRGKSRLPQLVILDSSPGFVDRTSEEWQLTVSEMRRTVTNLGIWDPPTSQVTRLPSLESYQIAFEPEIHISVAKQRNTWACGVHTIMNAWADALLFKTDPACEMDPNSYRHAVNVINLVLGGRATLHLVSNLLVRTGFVLQGNREQSQGITELREGSEPFEEYHQINSTANLDSLIAHSNYEAMQRLEALSWKNEPNSVLALSVARTMLPRLRKTDLDRKVKAARKADKTRVDEGKDEEEG